MASFSHMIFYIENIRETLKFYSEVFGFKEKFVHESGAYAELDTGQTKLAFASIELGKSNVPSGLEWLKKSGKPFGLEIAITVDDVKTQYEHALMKGAINVLNPTEKPWGQTVAYIKDPNGILIEIASKM